MTINPRTSYNELIRFQPRILFCIAILGIGTASAQPPKLSAFESSIVSSLTDQIRTVKTYDPAYTSSGTPTQGRGVCTDVVLRAYLVAGVDIRRKLNSDMAKNPRIYGARRPDPKIDHRRCRNQITWFQRFAKKVQPGMDLRPGDVVFWSTRSNGPVDHVGVLGSDLVPVHHWPGQPVRAEKVLNAWKVRGIFRFNPKSSS